MVNEDNNLTVMSSSPLAKGYKIDEKHVAPYQLGKNETAEVGRKV